MTAAVRKMGEEPTSGLISVVGVPATDWGLTFIMPNRNHKSNIMAIFVR